MNLSYKVLCWNWRYHVNPFDSNFQAVVNSIKVKCFTGEKKVFLYQVQFKTVLKTLHLGEDIFFHFFLKFAGNFQSKCQ